MRICLINDTRSCAHIPTKNRPKPFDIKASASTSIPRFSTDFGMKIHLKIG